MRKVLDDKNVGDSEAVRRYFFGTKGEDRNSFISIHRNKFAVQKQRVSDGAMKSTQGEAENKEKGRTEIKKVKSNRQNNKQKHKY